MKQTKPTKLTLRTESLRALSQDRLDAIRGGSVYYLPPGSLGNQQSIVISRGLTAGGNLSTIVTVCLY
jgi:hypothetical protein